MNIDGVPLSIGDFQVLDPELTSGRRRTSVVESFRFEIYFHLKLC